MDLRPVLRGEIDCVVPTILRREDGAALFYRGRVNSVHGDSGDGKTWAAEIAAAQEMNAGEHVVWIDFEDPDGATIVERLRVLDLDDGAIAERLHYHRPVEPFDDTAVELIIAEVIESGATFVVVDSLGEAFGLEGIDEDRDVQVNIKTTPVVDREGGLRLVAPPTHLPCERVAHERGSGCSSASGT